jgi:predicted GH43/DUF377 family glycosyl hydrolase
MIGDELMKRLLFLLVFLTACAAPVTQPTPAPSPTSTPRPIVFSMPKFVFQGQDSSVPVLTHNPSVPMKNLFINPGAVLFHEGKFHMFFNSFTTWPGVVKVGYATSTDGDQWQVATQEPVLTTDQIPFGDGKADVSSAVVLEDGTWVLYFHTISAGQIGRLTAASPLGPWTADPEPVLTKGPQGAWDRYGVSWPCVIKDEDGFRMYYGGQDAGGNAIGLATSSDGIHWTKYDDPATTSPAFAESDPVLVSSADWESNKVDRPRVALSPDGWAMIYQAGAVETRGLALSNDGIHWEKYASNPIFSSDVFPIPRAKTWDTNLLYRDGAYYYFMELGGQNGTDIYLTKHEGSLRN